MSDAVKELFTTISPTYDRLNHFLSFNCDKRWRQKTIAVIRKNPLDAFRALDVCCGTHDLGIECLKRFPNATVTGLDFSEGMLAAGENKIARERAVGKIIPMQGDALAMPFEDASFDVAFCAYGVRNFDDAKKGLREIRRVLKPGGQLIILEFFRPTGVLSRLFHRTYAENILPRVGAAVSGHPSAYSYLRDSIRGFLSVAEFEAALLDCGFVNPSHRNFFMAVSTCVSAHRDLLAS